jgi:putative colanic acid biosynthesis acetyltransferase WcaF
MKLEFPGNSYIQSEDFTSLPPTLKIGSNTRICAKKISIENDVTIGSNTIISADNISIGLGSEIQDNCTIKLIGNSSNFVIGDRCIIGDYAKIIVPNFKVGDYVTLHNHLLVNGYKDCIIGHNIWIGQNCILNATDNLTIGNNVGIGAYSSIWTHANWGEKIEGCRIFKISPTIIEDDVIIEGSYNVISPGLTIGRKAVVLTGSVVTKNVLPFTCVAGTPAVDITEKVQPYTDLTLEEKYQMMRKFIEEFLTSIDIEKISKLSNGWFIKDNSEAFEIIFLEEVNDDTFENDPLRIVFTKNNNLKDMVFRNTTVFDLSTKKYTKKRTSSEFRVIHFLFAFRARFLPA